MHKFLGLFLDEWTSLLVLGTGLIGILTWCVRRFIVDPITEKVGSLTEQLKQLQTWSEVQVKDINVRNENLDKIIDSHENRLTAHDEKIKTLFREVERNEK